MCTSCVHHDHIMCKSCGVCQVHIMYTGCIIMPHEHTKCIPHVDHVGGSVWIWKFVNQNLEFSYTSKWYLFCKEKCVQTIGSMNCHHHMHITCHVNIYMKWIPCAHHKFTMCTSHVYHLHIKCTHSPTCTVLIPIAAHAPSISDHPSYFEVINHKISTIYPKLFIKLTYQVQYDRELASKWPKSSIFWVDLCNKYWNK